MNNSLSLEVTDLHVAAPLARDGREAELGAELVSTRAEERVEHGGSLETNDVDPLGRNLTRDTIYFPGKYILDGFVINHRSPRAGVYSFETMSVA
jgi:hypothetical protein